MPHLKSNPPPASSWQRGRVSWAPGLEIRGVAGLSLTLTTELELFLGTDPTVI